MSLDAVNYFQLQRSFELYIFLMLRLCFPLAIEWPATTPVEISVLISNCQL